MTSINSSAPTLAALWHLGMAAASQSNTDDGLTDQ
jgi:hypothetical protein